MRPLYTLIHKISTCSTALVLGIGLSLSSGLNAAELPQLPSSVMWFAHLDVETAKKGQIGTWAIKLSEDPKIAPKSAALEAITGFKPLRDLQSITLAGTSTAETDALILATGNFDAERLVILLKASDQYQELRHGSHSIHQWVDEGRTNSVCFLSNKLLFSVNLDLLKKTIDAQSQNTPNELLNKSQILHKNEFLSIAAVSRLADLEPLPPKAKMLKQLDHMSMSALEKGDNLILSTIMLANDEATAEKIHNIGLGLLSLAELSDEIPEELLPIIQSINLSRNGTELQMLVEYPMDLLKKQITEHMKSK